MTHDHDAHDDHAHGIPDAHDTDGHDAHFHDAHAHDDHAHDDAPGLLDSLKHLIGAGGHSHGEMPVDDALEASERGLWALKVSLLGLGLTAAFQILIVLISGSVGLLADTIHNFSDALTALPLGIAFMLGRRPSNRRYTYGYGRAEDVAGVIIVLMILASAPIAAYESVLKLIDPQPMQNVLWVMLAAVVGFLGNEGVAIFRIRVGKQIGSAALIADGQHARIDGITSLAVLFGALGVWLGFPLADPIIGLLITFAILFIVRDTALTMWRRLMDAIDPKVVDTIERTASAVAGAGDVHGVRVRWLGHRLQAELHISVDEDLSTRDSNRIVEEVRHALFHAEPRLAAIAVHADPCGHSGDDPHQLTAHHERLAGDTNGTTQTDGSSTGNERSHNHADGPR